jgi:hypothetical protein
MGTHSSQLPYCVRDPLKLALPDYPNCALDPLKHALPVTLIVFSTLSSLPFPITSQPTPLPI